jgi:hypothetical protein
MIKSANLEEYITMTPGGNEGPVVSTENRAMRRHAHRAAGLPLSGRKWDQKMAVPKGKRR